MDSSLARARQQLFLSEVANSAAGKTHERVQKSPPAHMLCESLGTIISFAFSEDINSSLNLESLVVLLKWGENVSGFLCSLFALASKLSDLHEPSVYSENTRFAFHGNFARF